MPDRAIIVVLLTVVINMTGVGLIWPILPTLVQELAGGTVSQTAILFGVIGVVYSLMQFLFAPVLGALSDQYGRRPVMLVALFGMGLGNILLALAPSISWIIVGRALGGIFGATFSVANAYMADVYEEKDRAGAFGLVGAAFGVGFVIGPLAGGVLGEIDIRLPFYCAAALSFANVVFGYFCLSETLAPEKRASKKSARISALASFRWMGASPVILPLAIALFLANTMQRGLESIWVLFTSVQYGWGSREAGFSLAVVGICFIFVQGFLVKRVVSQFGEIRTIAAGFSLSAVVYFLLAINQSGLVGYLGIIPHVIGWGVAGPALQSLASRQVDGTQQGQLQGGLTSITGLAAIVGPAFAAATFAYFTGITAPWHFPGAFFMAGSVFLAIAAYIGSSAGKQHSGTQ